MTIFSGQSLQLSPESTGATDPVNPSHYKQHPSGVEAITITEAFNFNIGNAIKYLWRAGLKQTDPTEDLQKAVWYIQRELQRISGKTCHAENNEKDEMPRWSR